MPSRHPLPSPKPPPFPRQDNHKSSAFKFLILAELLSVGVSVLLSDAAPPR